MSIDISNIATAATPDPQIEVSTSNAGTPRQNTATSALEMAMLSESGIDNEISLDEALAKLADFTKSMQRDLNFSVDDSTGKTVIKVIDSASDEVVRQIPSEVVLKLASTLDTIKGVLFDETT